MNPLPIQLATATRIPVDGVWQRHVETAWVSTALDGRAAPGRWGNTGGHLVLYLGRPLDSVVVEAYRHLVDPVVTEDGKPPPLKPRTLLTCDVSVTEILDLREPANRVLAGLTMAQMQSETFDKAAYAACQQVSAAAYQLGCHGLISPAATKLGEALTLFVDLLPAAEKPTLTATEPWPQLPPDPRKRPAA